MYYYSDKKLKTKIIGKSKSYKIREMLLTIEFNGYIYELEETEQSLFAVLACLIRPLPNQKEISDFITAAENKMANKIKINTLTKEISKIDAELKYAKFFPDRLSLPTEYIKTKKQESIELGRAKKNLYYCFGNEDFKKYRDCRQKMVEILREFLKG